LKFDLTVKAALHARAAIAEYWVLDITGKRLLWPDKSGRGWWRG
jgi:hypothetical protein